MLTDFFHRVKAAWQTKRHFSKAAGEGLNAENFENGIKGFQERYIGLMQVIKAEALADPESHYLFFSDAFQKAGMMHSFPGSWTSFCDLLDAGCEAYQEKSRTDETISSSYANIANESERFSKYYRNMDARLNDLLAKMFKDRGMQAQLRMLALANTLAQNETQYFIIRANGDCFPIDLSRGTPLPTPHA